MIVVMRCQKEACEMAWELLTDVYRLPASHLYVTYFAGCKELGMPPDVECRDIWRNIGSVSPVFKKFRLLLSCLVDISVRVSQ